MQEFERFAEAEEYGSPLEYGRSYEEEDELYGYLSMGQPSKIGMGAIEDDIFSLDQDGFVTNVTPAVSNTAATSGNIKPRLIHITNGCEIQSNIEFANAAQDNYRLWLTRV
ncbi:HER153Wp [Eremothecium sinecaudum]|uniref:HER153Wp n=1 Tax=Eremothecium sinecaudum TaxID=45286 RepID=A0A0X8HTZ9_9SACH|nr:HER153Wp [Eremothecium sinecaudum]AMD21432.1 HER153Wp [Eremothecium sinecaudum]